jgi:predicted enzyme related to lactoylglutathione lyase
VTQKAHFGFTKLIVENLEASATFYKEVCGLTEMARVSAGVNDRKIEEIIFSPTEEGGATLVLWKWLDRASPVVDEVIIGFQTSDLAAFVDRATAAGAKIVSDIKDMPEHGVKVAFISDPENHLLEVVELLPR